MTDRANPSRYGSNSASHCISGKYSTGSHIMRELFDDTFAGIHQTELVRLGDSDSLTSGFWSCSRFTACIGTKPFAPIFKHRKKATGEPPKRFEQLPPVTIQLPLYNERYVVERLIDEVTRIEYPRELLQIQVLDDSTDDTHPFAEALCERYQRIGHSRSSIITAPIATATRPALCRRV